jgi:hypothetical protein
MINFKLITQAVKSILDGDLSGYTIERNAERNKDPNLAARGKGWINVQRNKIDYEPHTIGATPWRALVETRVEVQVASLQSGENAEDRLEDAVKDVMDVLTDNKKLNDTVATTLGYGITYEYNAEEQIWHHAAVITIRSEVRTG